MYLFIRYAKYNDDDDDENSTGKYDDNVIRMDIIKDKNEANSFYYIDKIDRGRRRESR